MENFPLEISLTFVIPDVNAFQSGGNIYNKKLIEGLKQIGYSPIVWDIKDFKKKKITDLKGYYFFDTLYFLELEKILANRSLNTQFFLIVHHLESLYPPKNWDNKRNFQEKELPYLKQFDGFLTSSQFTANYLTNNYLQQKKIVVPPAIDYFPTKQNYKKSSPIKALMVANLVERKGVLPFLQKLTTSSLIGSTENLQIDIIGSKKMEPKYAKQCLNYINKNDEFYSYEAIAASTLSAGSNALANIFKKNKHDLNKIICYQGQRSPTQLHSFYTTANLFISTSFMETYGMALQEARAFRLPILALDGGNVGNHIENGKTGFISANLADLIKQLEQLIMQPEILENLQKNTQQESVDFYDWSQAAQQFISYFKS